MDYSDKYLWVSKKILNMAKKLKKYPNAQHTTYVLYGIN